MTKKEEFQKEYNEILKIKNELKKKEKEFKDKILKEGYFIKNNLVNENILIPTISYNFVREDRYVGEVGMMYDTFEGLVQLKVEEYDLLNFIKKSLKENVNIDDIKSDLLKFKNNHINTFLSWESNDLENKLKNITEVELNKFLGELYEFLLIQYLDVEEYFFEYDKPIHKNINSIKFNKENNAYEYIFNGREKKITIKLSYMTEKDYQLKSYHEELDNVIL